MEEIIPFKQEKMIQEYMVTFKKLQQVKVMITQLDIYYANHI